MRARTFGVTLTFLLLVPVMMLLAPELARGQESITEDASPDVTTAAPTKSTSAGFPQAPKHQVVETYGKLPLSFEANQGQTGGQVKFLSRGRGYTLFLTADEAVLALQEGGSGVKSRKSRAKEKPRARRPSREPAGTAVLRMKLVGANATPKVTALEELPGRSNYFIGNDPKKWRNNVPNYAKVRYESVYPGIDLVYYGNQRQLEYDFVVAPGADPKAIKLAIAGAEAISVDAQGNLAVFIPGGEVRFHKPLVYQPVVGSAESQIANRKSVDGRYVLLAENRIAFELCSYDPNRPLIIDPVLQYSTYLGGWYGDWAEGIAVDSSGNAYVTGGTLSDDFPTMNPIYGYAGGTCGTDPTYPCPDAFVSKLNAAGDALVYSTYLGGTAEDWAYGIAVDSSGNAYVTGETWSSDFPLASPIRDTYGDGGDAFVTKLNATGSSLVYSTYYYSTVYGESRYEGGYDVAVGATGDIYIGGAVETDTGDANVLALLWQPPGYAQGTYFGGSDDDWAESIAVDSSGNVYLTGLTFSNDFYTTANTYQPNFGGGTCGAEPDTYPCPDAFVRKYLPGEPSTTIFSTYLGGNSWDDGLGLTIDSSGYVYVTGSTISGNFPTEGPYQATLSGSYDAFVTKFDPTGSALVFSTYLGGNDWEEAFDIALDSSGNPHIAGNTASTNFPTVDPLQLNVAGDLDAFVSKLNSAGSALLFSSFLGGSDTDEAYGIVVDSSGSVYAGGETWSSNFPTANALQPGLAGVVNAFISKISFVGISLLPASLDFGTVGVGVTSSAKTATLSNNGTTVLTIIDISTSGDFAETDDCGSSLAAGSSCTISVTFTPTTTGTRNGELTVTSDAADSPHVVSLTGEGTTAPLVVLSPTTLDFGTQAINVESPPKTVTLTNDGGTTLSIASITATGDFDQTNDCGSSLAASASCTISVTFTPTVEGVIAGQVTVTSNAPDSPHVVTLSGTGTQAQPGVSLSTTLIDFGARLITTTSDAQTVTVTNIGTAALNVSSVGFASGDVDDFTRGFEDCTTRSPIAEDGQCTVSLTFNPTAVGDKLAVVSITSDAPGSPHTVNLAGTGTDFALEISSGSSTSQTVTAGNSATYTLDLEPSGFSGSVTLTCSENVPYGECSVSPTSLTLDGSTIQHITVRVTTTARGMAPPSMRLPPPGAGGRAPWLLWLLILAMLAGATLVARRRAAWGLAVVMLSVILWAGCGGDGNNHVIQGTPAGTYSVTVTATAGGVSKPVALTLTVN